MYVHVWYNYSALILHNFDLLFYTSQQQSNIASMEVANIKEEETKSYAIHALSHRIGHNYNFLK